MRRSTAAIAFLTRFPIRTAFTAEDVGRAAIFYPVVGAGIGALQLGLFRLARAYVSPLALAVLVVSLSAWATRGLHLDGLADFADGLGGGRSREDALRIMKDSRIGAFGAIALVLVLAAKIAATESLASPVYLVLAPALARWTPVVLGFLLPDVREGSAPVSHVGKMEVVGATILTGALSLLALGLAAAMWLSVVVVIVLVGWMARRRLGGVTGDVLGACVELAEAAALLVAA